MDRTLFHDFPLPRGGAQPFGMPSASLRQAFGKLRLTILRLTILRVTILRVTIPEDFLASPKAIRLILHFSYPAFSFFYRRNSSMYSSLLTLHSLLI
jgi:hypothetical protein